MSMWFWYFLAAGWSVSLLVFWLWFMSEAWGSGEVLWGMIATFIVGPLMLLCGSRREKRVSGPHEAAVFIWTGESK